MTISVVTLLQRRILPALLFTLLCSASPLVAQLPVPFRDPSVVETIRASVDRFLKLSSDSLVTVERIDDFATGEFAEHVKKSNTPPVWTEKNSFRVAEVMALGSGDSVAVVNVITTRKALPLFGDFDIDWTFFVRLENGVWKVSELRRLNGQEDVAELLQYIDTSSSYPASLKPEMAREHSALLLSNDQLRRHFAENREKFLSLAGEFTRGDSVKIIAREGNRVAQFNNSVIAWGMAAHDIPEQAINEYLSTASPAEQERIRTQLRTAETMRRAGNDSLVKILRKKKVAPARVEKIVKSMHDLRLIFVNTQLPWNGAVQMTVAGQMDDAVGYIYSPKGGVPHISTVEYFYLEDLGNGWWLFRAT